MLQRTIVARELESALVRNRAVQPKGRRPARDEIQKADAAVERRFIVRSSRFDDRVRTIRIGSRRANKYAKLRAAITYEPESAA